MPPRLNTLKPRLQTLKPRMAAMPAAAAREGGRPWRRTRERVLVAAMGLCQCDECKTLGRVRLANEVHHVVPLHLGGAELDEDNLLAVNDDCHKRITAEEAAARGDPWGADASGRL